MARPGKEDKLKQSIINTLIQPIEKDSANLTVNIKNDAHKALEDLKKLTGKTKNEIVESAIYYLQAEVKKALKSAENEGKSTEKRTNKEEIMDGQEELK